MSRIVCALDWFSSASLAAFPAPERMIANHTALALLVAVHRAPIDDRTADDAFLGNDCRAHGLVTTFALRDVSCRLHAKRCLQVTCQSRSMPKAAVLLVYLTKSQGRFLLARSMICIRCHGDRLTLSEHLA
jgi:hypothetical protein